MVVRIHRQAEPSLLAWARSLAAEPAEALAFADIYYDAIERELIRTNGRPGRAVRIPAIEPETWLRDFQAGRYWIVYVIRPGARRWWLSRLLWPPKPEVVILGFQDRAPTPADLLRLTTGRTRPA